MCFIIIRIKLLCYHVLEDLKVDSVGNKLAQYKQKILNYVNRIERHKMIKSSPLISVYLKIVWTTVREITKEISNCKTKTGHLLA
jgi:hypothetical protein